MEIERQQCNICSGEGYRHEYRDGWPWTFTCEQCGGAGHYLRYVDESHKDKNNGEKENA